MLAGGGEVKGAEKHRSWEETRDTCLCDGLEETGRDCSDMSVYYHLGVKGPQRGQ